MKPTTLERLAAENVFEAIGKEWMLVTAGTATSPNTMTASWGGLGWIWNKPVAFVFVRPERFTHHLIEENERLTLSFYGHDEAMRKMLSFCGSASGRHCDKVKEAGLTPEVLPSGAVTFTQARLTLVGRKLFHTEFLPDNFIDKEVLARWYNDRPGGSLHTMYIVEIEEVFEASL